jgi:hypothetical protein
MGSQEAFAWGGPRMEGGKEGKKEEEKEGKERETSTSG